VINALLGDLAQLRKDGVQPDLVVFTGDLVQAGTCFEDVKAAFIDPLRAQVGGAPIIIAPGNHDIQRDVVRDAGGFIEAGLKSQLNSVDKLNAFIDALVAGNSTTAHATERLANFEAAHPTLGCPATVRSTPLLKTYVLALQGRQIGVAAFNTAWRATGEPDSVDRHFLLLGERHVDLAIEDLKDCDVRISSSNGS
jgi:predicted MPP superfamily phosphohydrolase